MSDVKSKWKDKLSKLKNIKYFPKMQMPKKPHYFLMAFLAIWALGSMLTKPKTVYFDYLKAKVEDGSKLEISLYEYGTNSKIFYVKINGEKPERTKLPVYLDAIKEQEANFKSIGYELPKNEMNYFETLKADFFLPLFLALAGVSLLMVIVKGVKNKQMEGRAEVSSEVINVKFDDIKGIDNIRGELEEVISIFKDSSKVKAYGGKPIKGALMYGPPGTGKTLMAKAVAGEAGAKFYAMSGSEFMEMYVGVGPRRVRDLFALARSNKPAVIFIDEIDAMAGKRGRGSSGGDRESDSTVNEFLTQMDGMKHDNTGILIIGATNRLDNLDEAVVRAGRFDRKIKVGLPTEKGRLEILNYYLAKIKIKKEAVNVDSLAKATAQFSGADLANLVNESTLLAVREGSEFVMENHLYEAKDKVQLGLKQDLKQTVERKKETAFHEVGHAYVGYVKKMGRIAQVSIEPRERSLGVTQMVIEEVYSSSKEDLENNLLMLLAGRVAERVFCKTGSNTGASDDLKRAANIARVMVTELGMGDMGPVNFSEQYSSLSDQTKAKLDEEVVKLLKDKEKEVEELLLKDEAKIRRISEILLQKESLKEEEFEMLMNQQPQAS